VVHKFLFPANHRLTAASNAALLIRFPSGAFSCAKMFGA
jgi:hypothetical protein